MNLLYANDRHGQYPQSWYAATADIAPERAALLDDVRADVCVVGAGYTGLSAARKLSELYPGQKIIIVDAQLAGEGASGRS